MSETKPAIRIGLGDLIEIVNGPDTGVRCFVNAVSPVTESPEGERMLIVGRKRYRESDVRLVSNMICDR